MKKTIITVAVAALAAVATSTGASAGNGTPTCSDFNENWANHGTHVREDYVFADDGAAGASRGGPAHLAKRPDGPAPGASFCLDQANSPGLHF